MKRKIHVLEAWRVERDTDGRLVLVGRVAGAGHRTAPICRPLGTTRAYIETVDGALYRLGTAAPRDELSQAWLDTLAKGRRREELAREAYQRLQRGGQPTAASWRWRPCCGSGGPSRWQAPG
jgi:hypothetical protein